MLFIKNYIIDKNLRMVNLNMNTDNLKEIKIEDFKNINFYDIFDINEIQQMQDLFADAHGVASLITDINGSPITKPSNFTNFCENIIRKTEIGCANCYKSDAIIGSYNPKGANVQQCLSGGLWDAGASITVGGKHIANWLIGQVRNEANDLENLVQYADVIGTDKEAYEKELKKVPVMSVEKFTKIANLLFYLANLLSEKAFSNLLLRNEIVNSKQINKKLKDSKDDFRNLIELSPVAMAVIHEWKSIYFNPSAVQLFGAKSQNELLNKHIFDFLHSDYKELAIENSKILSVKGYVDMQEQKYLKLNGSTLDVEIQAKSIKFNDHPATLIVIQDITERKKNRENLIDSEMRFRKILEDIETVSVQGYAADGTTQYWNKASERLYGYTAQEAIGKNLIELIIPTEMHMEVKHAMEKMSKTGEPIPTSELVLKRKDNSLVTVLSNHTIVEVSGKPQEFFCIDIDLSEMKKAEEKLIKKNQDLDYMNKFMVNREVRMSEMKKEINELLQRLGEEKRYL